MPIKLILRLTILLIVCFKAESQEKLTWNDFSDVDFTPIYNVIYEQDFLVPTFGERIKSFEGKTITIKGYYLDLAGDGEFVLLSKQPMATCFFCGGAGPDTIIELVFKHKPNFTTDQVIEVTGKLKLNTEDIDHCNYILTNATATLVK